MNLLVTKWEGLRLLCYDDGGGVATIGYGHIDTVTKADIGRKRITKAQAEELLRKDLLKFEGAIMRKFPGIAKDLNRYNALVSFVFNCGLGALDGKGTKIAYWVRKRRWSQVAAGVLQYTKDNGVVLDGLVNRRVEEASILIRGS